MQKYRFYLFSALLSALLILTSCTRTVSTPLVEMQLTTTPTASQASNTIPSPSSEHSQSPTLTPSLEAVLVATQTPEVTITATTPPQDQLGSTSPPPPTFVPTLDPNGLADRLGDAFVVNELPGTNGHPLLQITGWEYGFRSPGYCKFGPYRWLDETHLLLFPKVGEEEGMGTVEWTRPVVINMDGNAWLPPVDARSDRCRSVEWSPALQALISSQDGNLLVSKVDGGLLKSIAGKGDSGFMLSPSGEKILAHNTWIDLINDNEIYFGWDAGKGAIFIPAWTQDEARVFNCCYAYGDATSGEAGQFNLGGLVQVGRGLYPGFSGIESRWVLSDTHSMTLWDFYIDGDQIGIVPLFVPEAQAYVDVRNLVGIPADQYCQLTSVSPDGNLIWMNCGSQDDYLIDLRSYDKNWFTEEQLSAWSTDSQFALIARFTNFQERLGNFELFSTTTRQRQMLSDTLIHEPVWSPQGQRLAYLSEDGQKLVLENIENNTSQSASLPGVFQQILWSPNANSLALVAKDGSLWLVDVYDITEPEQISSPLPGAHDVRWSPDGSRLSLVSGNDLYIVK
jgi:WD40 repeat protein